MPFVSIRISGGQLLVDRDAPKTTPAQEDAHAEPSR